MKVGAIIQARTGSTRLPGKVLLDLNGDTVLSHVIRRVSLSKKITEIIIATTDNKSDDKIVEVAEKLGVKFFRGSESDVLSRYYYAAKENDLDIIVRITSDCPLIDPNLIDSVIEKVEDGKFNIATNAGNDVNNRKYPRGLDTEVFTFSLLEEAYNNANQLYQREHVTPYIYENSESVFYDVNHEDLSNHRWTLDTEEDFELISNIYNNLYKGKHDFFLEEILEYIKKNPELMKINEAIEQKKLGE